MLSRNGTVNSRKLPPIKVNKQKRAVRQALVDTIEELKTKGRNTEAKLFLSRATKATTLREFFDVLVDYTTAAVQFERKYL